MLFFLTALVICSGFNLGSGSPAIDAGIYIPGFHCPVPGPGNGTCVPWNGTKPDIGACESSGTDTTSPVVSIKSPANGATVSGSVNFTVTATDNVGVTKIERRVDNVLVTTSLWNTAAYTNGSHILKGIAFDAAGNQSTHTITVTVNNALSPPPSNLTLTKVPGNKLRLNWQDNSNNETGFEVFHRQSISPTWLYLATVGPNITTYTTRLNKRGPTYCYVVRALGSVFSNEICMVVL